VAPLKKWTLLPLAGVGRSPTIFSLICYIVWALCGRIEWYVSVRERARMVKRCLQMSLKNRAFYALGRKSDLGQWLRKNRRK